MRILHLGKYFPPHPGGIERYLSDLLQAQRAAGLDAHALVHGSPPTAAGLPDHVEAAPCVGQLGFVPVCPSWPLHLARAIRRLQPDLIHAHVPNPSAFWLLASAAARRRPWLLHWHADIPQDSRQLALRLGYPVYRQFERALLQRSAAVIATSPSYLAASPVLQDTRVPVHVVPLGLPAALEPSPAPRWPGPGLRLLAVGRLSYYKGFDILLRALHKVDNCSLLLIGDGEQSGALQRQVLALGLQSRVELRGGVDDAGVEAAYRSCDVLCLPSIDRAEAFGLVLLEAMRAGKPVISSEIPGSGVCDVVVDGQTGLKVPRGDADALSAAIVRLAGDPSLRDRLGSAGRDRFHSHYSISASAQGVHSLYRQLLAASPATAGP